MFWMFVHVFHTLSLDVGHIQALFQPQDDSTKLGVKGITETNNTGINITISSGQNEA